MHRSEEILPSTSRHLMRQGSSQSSEEIEGEGERCETSPIISSMYCDTIFIVYIASGASYWTLLLLLMCFCYNALAFN